MSSNQDDLNFYFHLIRIQMSSTGIVNKLANDLDMPVDLFKTTLLMALSIPLSLVFKVIAQPTMRYAYSLIIGLFYIFYLLEEWAFYVLAVALVPFILFNMFKKYCFQISILSSIMFLMFIHTYRFMYDYKGWKIDCSVSVMILVTKVVYYGNYAFKHQKQISLFKYLSYCLYFPSVLIGPNFSYAIFEPFIEKTQGYKNQKLIWKLIVKEIVKTIIFTVATVKLMPIFTPHWLLQNQWYLGLNPLFKFLSLNVIGIFYRIKFYCAWGFTQIAVDLSGLSWNQKQQNYSNVRAGSFRFQTELNPRNKTNYWNSSVQLWLKQMIFDKVVSQTKSTGFATFVTFFTSALWHGVYFTYYVGFIQWALIIIISKWAYKMAISMPKLADNIVVKATAWLISSSLLNYTGTFIVVLTWKEAVQVYKDMYFIGNILIAVLLIASFVIRPKKQRNRKIQEVKQVQQSQKKNE